MPIKHPQYRISMVPFVPWSVYNVAQELGFWEEQGLDVQVQVCMTEEEYGNVLTSGQSDFYPLPMASMIDFLNDGIDLVYLGILEVANGHKHLLGKTGYSIQQLLEKPVALYCKESTTLNLLARFLARHQLKISDIDVIELDGSDLETALAADETRLILTFREVKDRIQENFAVQLLFTTGDYIDPFGLTTTRSKIDKIPKADLKNIYQGRLKALAWIKNPNNWDHFMEVINTKTYRGLPDLKPNQIKQQFEEMQYPDRPTLLALNQNDITGIFNTLKETAIQNMILNPDFHNLFDQETLINNVALVDALK
jgi:ABC-type nitrate/sulfonate/bicarbonate transport system substrate-binding protein